MAIPLPNAVADVGPGGGIVTSMRGQNALINDIYSNKVKKAEALYAPWTQYANALSHLAYSYLMGPQFVAKMLGNKEIAANMNNPQGAVGALQAAGMGGWAGGGQGGGTGAPWGMPTPDQLNQGGVNPLQAIGQAINYFRGQGNQPFAQPQATYQPPALTPQNQVQNMQPGDALTNTSNQPVLVPFSGNQPAAPAQPVALAENAVAPVAPVSPIKGPSGNDKYFEKSAKAQGIEKEGEKLGEIRATQIGEYGDEYKAAINVGTTYDTLKDIITSDEWKKMRKEIPFFQGKQLDFLSKTGTKAQQQMIGNFITSAQEVVKDTLNSFTGARLKGELGISQNMKISKNDTADVAIGKLQAAMYINKMREQYASIVPKIMKEQHVDEQDAIEQANKIIKPKEVRKKIMDSLNPTVTLRNKKTGEVKTMTIEEARKLGVANV